MKTTHLFKTTLGAFLLLTATALPYGDTGHQVVGAIADQVIAGSPNTLAKVRALLGTETLEHAATWADDCKYHYDKNDADMVEFVKNNPQVGHNQGPHDHHAYHYTDIPIQEKKYSASSVGASKIDVVHMIRNCIAIIEGNSNATNNPTHITPKTALKLLVHYVGDIHQPLHVGAVYFDASGQPANPNTTPGTKFAIGGNSINFHSTNLHSYWDSVTVTKAMSAAGQTTPRAFAQTFITTPPPGWQTSSYISGWPTKWANEVLPIATEAHGKLTFHANAKSWGAKSSDLPGYDKWAREQVSLELGRAGYRLAAILKKVWP